MTQGELEKIALPIQQNMSTLEDRIMADIVRRIKINGEITSAADWQINRLYQMGVSKKEIKKAIGEAMGMSKAEVKKLYHDTLYNEYVRNQALYKEKGHKWIAFEKNKELQNLIAAVEEQTNKELKNITQSLGFAIRGPDGKIIQSPLLEFYQGTLDDAMMDISSGAFDYSTVLRRTIQTMTNSGLRTIDYDSGWSNRVEVAARRAVVTGFNQLQGKINEQVARDLKTDYFEVSWHGGARPDHQVWQGRVFSKKQLETVCGLGTVTGLLGANCYHQYNAFIPGVSARSYTDAQLDRMNAEENRPKKYNGKEYTTYEALQHQRKMETLMRKQRQDIKLLQEGKAVEDDILAAKVRYRTAMGQYVDFSDKMGLPQQRDRIFGDGLGRMITGKESTPVKVPTVAKAHQTGIMKLIQDSKDFDELEEFLRTQYKVSIPDSIRQLHFEAVKQSLAGLDRVANEFPQAKPFFKGVTISDHGIMAAGYDGSISFNPNYYDRLESLDCMIMGSKTGFHPKNTGISEIGSHEMGHLLERALIGKHTTGVGGVQAWNDCSYAKSVVSEACKAAKKTEEGKGMLNAGLKKQISGYSLSNDSECLAEAVADCMANGENASILSKEIWQILKRELG